MKTTHWKAVTVVTMLLASSWLVAVTVSESVYDPWCDLDEDRLLSSLTLSLPPATTETAGSLACATLGE